MEYLPSFYFSEKEKIIGVYFESGHTTKRWGYCICESFIFLGKSKEENMTENRKTVVAK